MLRLRRPVVIVDEAHNARTDLSFTTLGNVLPSCIVEFTATPATRGIAPSNVLHRVSAAELKAADMVKLPLRVITRHPSQRDHCWRKRSRSGPIWKSWPSPKPKDRRVSASDLLLQAERVDACEALRDRLTKEFPITKDEVNISVGMLDELPTAEEIKSAKCPRSASFSPLKSSGRVGIVHSLMCCAV